MESIAGQVFIGAWLVLGTAAICYGVHLEMWSSSSKESTKSHTEISRLDRIFDQI